MPVSDDDTYCVSLGEAPLLPVGGNATAAVCVAVDCLACAEGVSVTAKLPVGLVVIEAVGEGVERPLGDCERVGDADWLAEATTMKEEAAPN